MREIHIDTIIENVKTMCIKANEKLPHDVESCIKKACNNEVWPTAQNILSNIVDNIEIAKEENVPLCQDTGMAVFFVKLGQEVHITGGLLTDAINEGVRQGYQEGYLRKSVVKDPLNRVNTKDNTPAVIHYDLVSGDNIEITFAPKGFGSENMSQTRMLPPSAGVEGVRNFVLESVKKAGPNPCPPIVVGVGIGGTFEKVAYLAKNALNRDIDEYNSDPYYEELEKSLLSDINALGIGPMGFGGKTTALKVSIETYPTHIAGLPVAININCHVARHLTVVL